MKGTRTREIQTLEAAEAMAGFGREIDALAQRLKAAPQWGPGEILGRLCRTLKVRLGRMEERLERKLVVTIIGPCGAGKSTLLNALVGGDAVAPVGTTRPTTRGVMAVCSESGDADQIRRVLGDGVRIRSHAASAALDHLVVIDTPDTDSTAQKDHLPLIRRAVALSDVLICVFNAENPKTRDHVDLITSLAALFAGESLVVVLNKCDRLDAVELKETILPEFTRYLQRIWEKPPAGIFCLSARRQLADPAWDPGAEPRHAFDQFHRLVELLAGSVGGPGAVLERRVANARGLRDYLYAATGRRLAAARPSLEAARQGIYNAEQQALGQALEGLRGDELETLPGINLQLYQRLAQRWLGPMGVMLAIWARLMVFGMGMVSLLRFGRPLSQVAGLVQSLRQLTASREQVAATGDKERVGRALSRFRTALLSAWPDCAELLVRGGFHPSLRDPRDLIPETGALDGELVRAWRETLEQEIEAAARGLSRGLLQLVFNLPPLAIFGHMGWITVNTYLRGQYLSGDFFLHGVFTVGVVLCCSFFLFQMLVRALAGTTRISRRAFTGMRSQVESLQMVSAGPLAEQVGQLLALADELASTPPD